MPYGRGGAGNYEAAAAATTVKAQNTTTRDIEAQSLPVDGTESTTQYKVPAKYSHLGRGGAGNYYSPEELERTGAFKDTNLQDEKPMHNSSGGSQPPSTQDIAAPVYRGRGGAGNFEFNQAQRSLSERETQLKEAEEREQVRRKIAEDVEQGLAKPEKARLP